MGLQAGSAERESRDRAKNELDQDRRTSGPLASYLSSSLIDLKLVGFRS
jgi:hypothetical protein